MDDLKIQLREMYPDDLYERTLHCECDREAEERAANSFNALSKMFAEAAVRNLLKEEAQSDIELKSGCKSDVSPQIFALTC